MKRKYSLNDQIAVSETIGFMLILAIMVTGIGLVTLYGYPILLQEQANANIRNMERNIIVLQNDVTALIFKNIPYKETSMQINGGTLFVIRPNAFASPGQSYFTIHRSEPPPLGVDIPFNSADPLSTKFYPGLIQFESSSATAIIGLQNGAVVTNGFSETGGSNMLSEPRWFLDDVEDPLLPISRTLVINMIQIDSVSELSSNGVGTIQMSVSQLYPTQDINLVTIANPAGETIDITYADNGEGYSTAWQNYFKDSQVFTTVSTAAHPNPCVVSGSTLTIPDVTRIVIKTYKIEILNL
jgi:hypothetical protein